MKLSLALILMGWTPVDEEQNLWTHISNPDEQVGAFEAAARSNITVHHHWNPNTLSCNFCGITQYRVFVQGESARCSGTPDPKAFEDRANFELITARIDKAIGEDGWIWRPQD